MSSNSGIDLMASSRSKCSSKSLTSDSTANKPLFALRPNRGICGKNIAIFANHFPLKYSPHLMVYHYDIDMEPMRLLSGSSGDQLLALSRMTFDDNEEKSAKKRFRKLNNKMYRIVVDEAIKQYSGSDLIFDGILPVYDGQKNMYTTKPLDLEKHSLNSRSGSDFDHKSMARIVVEVNEDGRDVKYALNIKFASAIDMNSLKMYFDGRIEAIPSDAIQVLNIILRHGPTLYKIPIGNSLYATYTEASHQRQDIGGGRQLAYGYFQSVRPGIGGVNLVVDRTATALYESGFVPRFIAKILNLKRDEFMNLKQFRDSDRNRIKKELVGILVQVKHLTYKRKYKVIGITQQSAAKQEFEVKKTDPRGKEISLGHMTVVEFFEKYYPDVKLNFAHLPCLMVGSQKNPNYLPLDVCELVPDQHVRKNLTTDQMAQMIRASASQSPRDRLEFIKESAKATINESKPYMREFGISFMAGNMPLKIDGRVLLPPLMGYGVNRTVRPFDGKWDMRCEQFFKAASLEHWIIIALSPFAERKIDILERNIIESGTKLGMCIMRATKKVTIKNYGPETIGKIFKKSLEVTNGKLQMILFIVCPKYEYLYESIKKCGDVDNSVVTQCIKESNLDNLRPPMMQNIMLKINTKLGGINAVLTNIEVLRKRTMIVGVDCSHPAVGDRMSKSVSACVSSFDDNYINYFATTRLQQKPQEITEELKEMMLDSLREYTKRNNGLLPEQMIIYRDGVSEGQFNAALQQEIKGLAQTFAKEREGYEPKLTYIVVQKRHHTRFFPMNLSEGVGRAKNVPPGLVVDTDVVSKTHFDYFLCSHEGIQGTSRPTHYFVLWDDNNLSADQLQQLTFSLTHIYARCTRSISYPAPVAYAHLAAYRAQRHIIGYKQCDDSDSGSIASYPAEPRRHQRPDDLISKIEIKPEFKSKMYFC